MERLPEAGFSFADAWLPAGLSARLLDRIERLQAEGQLANAGLGRQGARRQRGDIRRAATRWLEGDDPDERAFLDLAETIRLGLNRLHFLGLFEFECQFIAYPVGGFYARHLDSLAGARNRIVSLVAYLDENWLPGEGGSLVIWPEAEGGEVPLAEILPKAGRLVLMMSERMPHEVRPATRPRHAIAGWWRLAST